MFEGTGLVVPPFAELPAGGRVTRWKLVPGVTSKDAVGVAAFALAGSVSAFGKEKGEKCLVAPSSLQKSSSWQSLQQQQGLIWLLLHWIWSPLNLLLCKPSRAAMSSCRYSPELPKDCAQGKDVPDSKRVFIPLTLPCCRGMASPCVPPRWGQGCPGGRAPTWGLAEAGTEHRCGTQVLGGLLS